jgi:hypothetical protein
MLEAGTLFSPLIGAVSRMRDALRSEAGHVCAHIVVFVLVGTGCDPRGGAFYYPLAATTVVLALGWEFDRQGNILLSPDTHQSHNIL